MDKLVPYINKLFRRLLFSKTTAQFDLSYNVFNFDCLFKQYVTEWSIPFEHTRLALLKLKRLIDTEGFKVHFPVEVRFVKGDDIWLSPCYGGDRTYIGIIMYRPYGKDVPYRKYFEGFQKIMEELGTR